MAPSRVSAQARGFRLHIWAFVLGNAALSGANWLTSGTWWAFWPLAAWGVVLAVHYLVYKARAADERWAETRAADVHSKSYDASHIDSIAERYDIKPAQRENRPK